MSFIKAVYIEVPNEEASKHLEWFLYSIVGLKFMCRDFRPFAMTALTQIAAEKKQPLTDWTK
jgi:hypothetical protein